MAKTKVTLSSADITDKWIRRMKNSVSDIQKGVDSVEESPGRSAAKNLEKARQKYVEAIDSGRMANALNKVDLNDWKNKTKKKVAERLGTGVEEARAKRQVFDDYLVAQHNSILPKVHSMPNMTFDDSMARIRTQLEHFKNNPYKK